MPVEKSLLLTPTEPNLPEKLNSVEIALNSIAD